MASRKVLTCPRRGRYKPGQRDIATFLWALLMFSDPYGERPEAS